MGDAAKTAEVPTVSAIYWNSSHRLQTSTACPHLDRWVLIGQIDKTSGSHMCD